MWTHSIEIQYFRWNPRSVSRCQEVLKFSRMHISELIGLWILNTFWIPLNTTPIKDLNLFDPKFCLNIKRYLGIRSLSTLRLRTGRGTSAIDLMLSTQWRDKISITIQTLKICCQVVSFCSQTWFELSWLCKQTIIFSENTNKIVSNIYCLGDACTFTSFSSSLNFSVAGLFIRFLPMSGICITSDFFPLVGDSNSGCCGARL